MIAIASDHAGFPLKEEIKKFLEEKILSLLIVVHIQPTLLTTQNSHKLLA